LSYALPHRDVALIVLVCAVWALNVLIAAFALEELPPLLFTGLRMAVLALLLLPFLRWPPAGQWPRLLAICLCLGVLHFGLSFWALDLAGDLSSLTILMQSYVPMAAVLAWVLLGERIGRGRAAAIAVSLLGVLVLGFDPIVLDHPVAMALTLASALMLALATVLMRGLQGQSVWSQQGWLAVISVGPLLGLSLLLEGPPLVHAAQAGLAGWGGVFYSALVSSLIGHGLYYVLLQRHPVAAVTPWLLLSPLMTVVLGVAVWGDRPGPTLWLGGAMVLGGVLVIALQGRYAERAPRP